MASINDFFFLMFGIIFPQHINTYLLIFLSLGFSSDDEDQWFEESGSGSGSGDGCFQIPTDGCTVSFTSKINVEIPYPGFFAAI
jgi:hypothetical protein